MPRRRFRPRLIPALATLALLILFVQLGLWQWGKGQRGALEKARHEQRGQLPARLLGPDLVDAAKADAQRFVVRGQYQPALQFFIDNRQHEGRAGLHVITPLKIDNSSTLVLVNRGWIGWTQDRQHLPQVAPPPPGVVEINATASLPSSKKFFLMPERPEASPLLWERLDLQRFSQQTQQPVQPVVLLQDAGPPDDGLLRHWPPPEDRIAKHLGYAWQWFGMALALLCFFVYASLRRDGVQQDASP